LHTTLNEREKAYDFAQKIHSATGFTQKPLLDESAADHPLGIAKCQIASSFIVAENGDELIIVDQHAAHERINLEKFKETALLDKSQTLTVPEILRLTSSQLDFLFEKQDLLQKYGIVFARHGADALALRQTNALLDEESTLDLVRTIAAEGSADASIIEDRLIYILGNIACKKSLKAGKTLSIEEMNGLLRQIEKT